MDLMQDEFDQDQEQALGAAEPVMQAPVGVLGPDAGAQPPGDVDALAAEAAGLRIGNASQQPLTADQTKEVTFLFRLLPTSKAYKHMTLGMLASIYSENPDAAREFVACVREEAGRYTSDKEFDLAKALSKPSPCGMLHAGSKAKENPQDIEGWLVSCQFWMAVQGVPVALQFCFAFFSFLHSDARAVVFPTLKDCSDPSDLMDGSRSWQEFYQGVLGSALGGRKDTDLQLFYKCLSKRADAKQPDTMQLVEELEALFSRMQQQLCDLSKICLVHRAVHPRLKDVIAYTADCQPWETYAAFRANLVNHAGPFDQQE